MVKRFNEKGNILWNNKNSTSLFSLDEEMTLLRAFSSQLAQISFNISFLCFRICLCQQTKKKLKNDCNGNITLKTNGRQVSQLYLTHNTNTCLLAKDVYFTLEAIFPRLYWNRY